MFAGQEVLCYEAATAEDVRRAHVIVACFKTPKRISDGWDFASLLGRLGLSNKEFVGKVLVHLDDASPEIQQATLRVLEEAVAVDAPVLCDEVRAVRERHRSTKLCDGLIQRAQANGQLV